MLTKGFLNSLLSLEVLKLTVLTYYPAGLSYIFYRFVDPKGIPTKNMFLRDIPSNPIPFTPLKELSIIYQEASIPVFKDFNILPIIDQNPYLSKFSLKLASKVLIQLELDSVFSINTKLKVLKLPAAFSFSIETGNQFCVFLKENRTLNHLHISETIILSKHKLIKAIQKNQTLKCLCLNRYSLHLESLVSLKDLQELLSGLALTKIEKFRASSNCFIIDTKSLKKIEKETIPDYIKNEKCEGFIKTVDDLLSQNFHLKKLYLALDDSNDYNTEKLADVILKHAKYNNLECFNGYNIKQMILDKVEILNIKDSPIANETRNFDNDLVSTIFSKIVPGMRNLRVITQNLSFESKLKIAPTKIEPIIVKNFVDQISDSKKIINYDYFSSTAEFLTLLLATSVKDLKIVEIKPSSFTNYLHLLPKILETFEGLKKFKFSYSLQLKNPSWLKSYFIVKSVLSQNSKLKEINFVLNLLLHSNDEIFALMSNHKTLQRIKIKKMKIFGLKNSIENSSFRLFSITKLLVFEVSDCLFSSNLLYQLAETIKLAECLNELKLKNIEIENKNFNASDR